MRVLLLFSLFLSAFACSSFAILSPGYGVGTTDFDWQSNGSMKKTVCLDAQHGLHVVWTYRINGDPSSRRAYYNFKDETGTWAFGNTGTPVDTRVSRHVTLSVLSTGEAVAAYHATGVSFAGTYVNGVAVDPLHPANPIWPGVAVGGNDVTHVIASSLGVDDHYYSRSTDYGQNWSPWTPLCSDGIGGGWFAMAAQGSKVALVYPESVAYTMRLRESTDGGVTWGAISMIDPGDTTISRLFQDALYGPTGELHVVYDVADTQATKPPSASQIRHWSSSTGVSLVRSGWWESKPGANHGSVACPQLGYNARTNTWWCTWVEFTLADTGANGWSNGEVWAAYSADGGRTWRDHRNLTNTPTPGAPAGECADDRYASLAAVVDDTLRVLYLSSFDAGSSAYEGSVMTVDTMRYYQIPTDSILGVEELASSLMTGREAFLSVAPNPFVSFAMVPGREGERFELYDITGRKVGTYQGERIGQDVGSGVYFLKAVAERVALTRIVKVR